MTPRRPRTAAQSTALPSLAALLASGVALDGCDDAAKSAQRQRRLTDEGQRAAREFDGRRPGEAATHIGIGLGLVREPTETRIQAPGEAPVVRTEPVAMPMGGAPAPVTPEPPDPRSQEVDGGIRHVDPTPPTPPPPPIAPAGAPMPTQVTPPPPPRTPHQPPPRINPRGGMTAVRPDHDDPL